MVSFFKQLPWLTIVALIFWYCFCGWVLSTLVSPPLHWLFLAMIAAGLAVLVNISWLLTLIPTLACGFWGVPFVLDAALLRGNDYWQDLVNTFSFSSVRGVFSYAALSFLLAVGWFSSLFWAKLEMQKCGFRPDRSFWLISLSSWLGLLVGWLIGRQV